MLQYDKTLFYSILLNSEPCTKYFKAAPACWQPSELIRVESEVEWTQLRAAPHLILSCIHKKLSAASALQSDPERLKTLAACQTNCLAGLLHAPNQWFTKHHKVHWEGRRERGRGRLFLFPRVAHACILACSCLCKRRSVLNSVCTSKNIRVWLLKSTMVRVCVCAFSCVSVYLHTMKEMDIYISSWLHFPESL